MPKVKDVSITYPDGTLEILDPDVLERGWTDNTQAVADCFYDRVRLLIEQGNYNENPSKILSECLSTRKLSDDELTSLRFVVMRIANSVERRFARQSPLSQHIAP